MASVKVKYLGFVHSDMKGEGRPGMAQCRLAHDMMVKKNLKKTRKIHPLFARGFDTQLRMEISNKGLYVALPESESQDGQEACLMNQQMHKIAFVASITKNLYILMKRVGSKKPGQFKCHCFVADSEATAVELTKTISRVTNEVFAKLRHVTRLLEAKKKAAAAPPKLAARKVTPDEEQPWYHGPIERKLAESLLAGKNNGLFLVRQSKSNSQQYALSFCYNQRVYHNKITKEGAEKYSNTKGSSFKSLSLMVSAYETRHEDMQTIITEYVAKDTSGGDSAYMNVSMVQEAAKLKMAATKRKGFDTTDIRSALSEIGDVGALGSIVESEAAGLDEIAYDSVYDEIQFGFGDKFIKQVLGELGGGLQPKADLDLNGTNFHLGDIEGEAEC